MSNSLSLARERLQYHALNTALSAPDRAVKSAQTYIIESEEPLPCFMPMLIGGEFTGTNRTLHHNFPMINCEFHFSRLNMLLTQADIDAVALDFPARLSGDPQLGGAIDTILFGKDSKIPYTVRPFVWREKTDRAPAFVTQALIFSVPLKLLKAPVT